jgi:endonuclease/exonuclease/phosphatase family metal-dependent hydrolase
MKDFRNKVICPLALAALIFAGGCASFFGFDDSFEIMSFNVRHCQGMDGKLDIERTAKVINDYSPRFVALQEIDKKVKRSKCVDQAFELGRLTKMYSIFAPAIDLQGGEYGVAMLSKDKPVSYKRINLPGKEPRMLLVVEFEDCYVATTHLALSVSNRLESAKIICETIKDINATKPVFVCGDWNALRTSSVLDEMRKGLVVISDERGRTFHGLSNPKGPSGKVDDFCIDYIAIDKEHSNDWQVLLRETVQDDVTSDHKPIIVSVKKK